MSATSGAVENRFWGCERGAGGWRGPGGAGLLAALEAGDSLVVDVGDVDEVMHQFGEPAHLLP